MFQRPSFIWNGVWCRKWINALQAPNVHLRGRNTFADWKTEHRWWFCSRPALISSLWSYSGSYRAPPFKNTADIYSWRSADGDAAALCTPAHPSRRRDGPGLTSEGLRPLAAHLKTHISCKKALRCRRLLSRFNLLRSWAPSLSLLAMKSLMLHTYIECSFFFLLRGKLYVLRRVLVLHG